MNATSGIRGTGGDIRGTGGGDIRGTGGDIRGTGGGYSGDQLNLPEHSNPHLRSNDPTVEYSDTKPINANIYGPEPTANVGGSNIKPVTNSVVKPIGGSNVQSNYGTGDPYAVSESNIRGSKHQPEYRDADVRRSNIKPNDTGGSRLQPDPKSRIDININEPGKSQTEKSGPDWNKIFLDDPT